MTRTPPLRRVLRLALLLLHLVGGVAASWADAHAEPATLGRVHVESTSDSTCPPVHSPDCGFCQHLRLGAEEPRDATPFLGEARASASAPSAPCAPAPAPALPHPSARGPPRLS